VEEWDWCFEDGTSARLQGHLRTLEQIVNDLLEARFTLERLIEQNQANVASASQHQLSQFPYIPRIDPGSAEAHIMHKLPRTLLIKARKKV